MLNLNSTIDLDFKRFFRWWKRELSFLVPEKIRRLLDDARGTLIVRPAGNQLELTYIVDGHAESLIKLERNESGGAQYKALLAADERLAKANLIFRLTNRYAIQKEISLPAAAEENLHQVVAYELSRYSPFNTEQAYFAVKRLNVDNEPGHVRVLLIITDRKVLDGFYEDLKAMGMAPQIVDYEGLPNDPEQSDENYNLLPESLRLKTAKAPRLIYSILFGLIFLLLAAVMALPVWFEFQAVKDLENKIIPIEKEAKKIKAFQSEIDSVIDETRKLIEEKNAAPAILVMLNTLSSLIKDDTWLTYFQYTDNQLQIQGESPAASTLISVLEASDLFANARFVSPVTQDNISKLERFQITVDTASVEPPGHSASRRRKTGGNDGNSK